MIKLLYPSFWQTRNCFSYLLWPVSKIYQLLGVIRKRYTKPIKFPAKVICVGNFTVGGTGKTQVVIWLASILKSKNIKFAIISKGYGSKLTNAVVVNDTHTPDEVGDESVLLNKYAKVIAAKRIKQASAIIDLIKPEVLIVDDGMQNPAFIKDFTISVIDSKTGFGNGFLFPAGPLRQLPTDLDNIDAIIGVDGNFRLANLPIFKATIEPNSHLDKAKKYLAFCGIGNPARFFLSLENYGAKIVKKEIFPDHYNYQIKDIKFLQEQAAESNASLVTTRKDYVKIGSMLSVECFDVYLSIENEQSLIKLIYEKILQKNTTSS